jgi:VanZ family protein
MNPGSSRLATAARILFFAALVFALVMSLLPKPPVLPGDPTDKVQHMLAFGTLTLLMGIGWPTRALWRIAIDMAVLGALIEVAQWVFPRLNRVADTRDWYADMIAAGAMLLLLALIRAGLRARSPEPAE